jgi:uncharacterized membrane protein YraQ (UPF0718 family)
MTTGTGNTAASRATKYIRLLGYFVFLAAFFLPACRQVATPGADPPDSYRGSFCAWITLINSFNRETWASSGALAILSGWINPLMLAYVAFLFSSRLRTARRIIAGLVALFILCTWVYFYLAPLVPLVGHYLWIAGILMILAGELVSARSAASAQPFGGKSPS